MCYEETNNGIMVFYTDYNETLRGGPRTAATSKMERFVIMVNG